METKLGDALLEKAEDTAGVMFDNLVESYRNNNITDVEIVWQQTDETDDIGTAIEVPNVIIDGLSAQSFARRILEYTTNDVTFINAAAASFEQKVACMWDSALQYWNELDDLSDELDELATGKYFNEAKQKFEEQGFVNIGDGEVLISARRLAIQDLGAWVAALDAQAEAVEG